MSTYQDVTGEVDTFFTVLVFKPCGKLVHKFVDKVNLNLIQLLLSSQLKVAIISARKACRCDYLV